MIHVYYRAHKIVSVRGKIIKTGVGVGLNRAISTSSIAMKLSGRRYYYHTQFIRHYIKTIQKRPVNLQAAI